MLPNPPLVTSSLELGVWMSALPPSPGPVSQVIRIKGENFVAPKGGAPGPPTGMPPKHQNTCSWRVLLPQQEGGGRLWGPEPVVVSSVVLQVHSVDVGKGGVFRSFDKGGAS